MDDVALNAELMQSVLTAEGSRTLTANDGPSSRAVSRSQGPDLILLDVMMPGESVFETCARLKSDSATSEIPITFLSALDDVSNEVTGLKIGSADFISKPVHGEEMLARVRVHLRITQNDRLHVEASGSSSSISGSRSTPRQSAISLRT